MKIEKMWNYFCGKEALNNRKIQWSIFSSTPVSKVKSIKMGRSGNEPNTIRFDLHPEKHVLRTALWVNALSLLWYS
jgi:hypothetical protein